MCGDIKIASRVFKRHASNDQIVKLINFIESFYDFRFLGGIHESSEMINELGGVGKASMRPSATQKRKV